MKFKLGDIVSTVKGCRMKGPFTGTVVGFGKWMRFRAVKVQKISGQVVMCLEKNLIRTLPH